MVMVRPKGKALKIARSVLKNAGRGSLTPSNLKEKDKALMESIDRDKKHIAKGY